MKIGSFHNLRDLRWRQLGKQEDDKYPDGHHRATSSLHWMWGKADLLRAAPW